SRLAWDDGLLKTAFWTLNIGLGLMSLLCLLPQGVVQAYHSINTGLWFARSPEVIHSPIMELLVWMRVPGDTIFSIGAVCIAIFAAKLVLAPREAKSAAEPASIAAE